MSLHPDAKIGQPIPGQTKDYFGGGSIRNTTGRPHRSEYKHTYPTPLQLGLPRVNDDQFRTDILGRLQKPPQRSFSTSSVAGTSATGSSEDLRRRIPLCFRAHRDLAGCFDQKAELFEPRTNVRNETDLFWDESLQDNVAMWYPLDQRPKWVESKAYQRCQLMGNRRQRDEEGFSDKLRVIRQQPAAGSRLGSGAYPHSFDYSSGKCLQDMFYLRNFIENSTAEERAQSYDAGSLVSRKQPLYAPAGIRVPQTRPIGDVPNRLVDNTFGQRDSIP